MNITGLWQQREGNLRGCRPVGNGQTFCEEIVCYQIIFSARPGLLTSSVEAWDRWQRGAAADLRSAAKNWAGLGGIKYSLVNQSRGGNNDCDKEN